jgi:prolyl-tRNA editing enzyme YbaK/EbsC (Cys-tRNA(Pro) deacylase)
VLVVASGTNRIRERTIAGHLGEKIGKADADFVRQSTGFVIGGVPPCGHHRPITIFLDQDLLALDEIWAAAGTPNAVFRLTPDDLRTLVDGEIIAVT